MTKSNFLEPLEENIHTATESALLRTVVADPDQTIGDILESLGKEPQTAYLLDVFKGLSISQIVEAAVALIQQLEGHMHHVSTPEPEAPRAPKAKRKPNGKTNGVSAKKKAPPKPKAKDKPKAAKPKAGKKDDGAIELTTPDSQKSYQAAIVKFLRAGGHKSKENGSPAAAIRKEIGGSADQLRAHLNQLIETKSCAYTGKARGTRYFIL